MDVKKLRMLSSETPIFRAFLEYLGEAENTEASTDIGRQRRNFKHDVGTDIRPADIAPLFEALQKLGVGKFIPNSNSSNPGSFEWKYNSALVCRIATGKDEVPKEWPELVRKPGIWRNRTAHTTPTPSVPSQGVLEGYHAVSYPIRGHAVTMTIPRDLTKAEARDLADFITKWAK